MGAVKGTITRRMDSVLDGLQSEFRSLCDKADFEGKIEALKKAGARSDRSSKLRKLFDMFDICGIEYERGKDNAYYEELVRMPYMKMTPMIDGRTLRKYSTTLRGISIQSLKRLIINH